MPIVPVPPLHQQPGAGSGGQSGTTGTKPIGTIGALNLSNTMFDLVSAAAAGNELSELHYLIRRKSTERFFGREPKYDTIFSLGFDDNITESEVLSKWGSALRYDRNEIRNFLKSDLKSSEWTRLGDVSDIEIVEYEVRLQPLIFSPADLLADLLIEDQMEADAAQQQELNLADNGC